MSLRNVLLFILAASPQALGAPPVLSEEQRVAGSVLSERQRVAGPVLSERQRVEGPVPSEEQRVAGPDLSERQRVEGLLKELTAIADRQLKGRADAVAAIRD